MHTAPFCAGQKTKCNYLSKSEYKTLINLVLTDSYHQVKREWSETIAYAHLKNQIENHRFHYGFFVLTCSLNIYIITLLFIYSDNAVTYLFFKENQTLIL